MDGCQTFQTGIVDTFQGADPEFQIRVYRVLHKHRNIHTLQCIGNFLHSKWVGSGACANPKDIDTCFQTLVYMLRSGYFGRNVHSGFFLHLFQPCQTVYAYTFETTRFGTRFPDSCTEYLHSLFGQLLGGAHYLFFCLGAARTCNYHGTFVLNTRQQNRF